MGSAAIQADHSIQEMQSENDFLKNQLNIVRQAMAEREKELAIRVSAFCILLRFYLCI